MSIDYDEAALYASPWILRREDDPMVTIAGQAAVFAREAFAIKAELAAVGPFYLDQVDEAGVVLYPNIPCPDDLHNARLRRIDEAHRRGVSLAAIVLTDRTGRAVA